MNITLYDITIITTILVGTFSGLIPYILYMFIFLIIGPYTTFILYCLILYYHSLK